MLNRVPRVLIAAVVLASFSVSLAAPAAEAGRHKGRRDKHGDHSYDSRGSDRGRGQCYRGSSGASRERVIQVRRSSDALPALAGFIGGLVVGATLAVASERDVAYSESQYNRRNEPDYGYYDPYCRESYGSLSSCSSHMRGCDHPRVVQVIDRSSGECVDTYRWQRNAGWVNDDQWVDEDSGSCRH